MHEEPTTVIIKRYLDALPGGTAAEPIVQKLLERAVGRLRLLCATFLYKSYPGLTRPPVKLETDELLGRVVAGLMIALQTARPPTVRRFFALANQRMQWQLNDQARCLDQHPAEVAAVVGVSEKTVQRRLNRARLLMAEQLADLRPPRRANPRRRWVAQCKSGGRAEGREGQR
jgi:hypothetical protein